MKPALNLDFLRSRLKLTHLESERLLTTRHPQAVAQLTALGTRPGVLRTHAAKLLAAGAATGTLFLSAGPSLPLQAALPSASTSSAISPFDLHSQLKDRLQSSLPPQVSPLTSDQEGQVSAHLHQVFGLHASAELEGNRLNRSYGLIGAEQHLPRFPGDTIGQHDQFLRSGITPGLGSWRYFAPSKDQLTPDLILKEKYYVAVQTLYLPDWTTRLPYLRDWYKYRKVVVVNPQNGKVIIGDVADSGPAAWTGKHFGGSPEIMAYLKLNVGKQKGPVILFFVDDPEDKVPLGPLEYNLEKGPPLLSAQ